MKILITNSLFRGDDLFEEGTVHDFSDFEAKKIIGMGKAIAAPEKAKKGSKDPQEKEAPKDV